MDLAQKDLLPIYKGLGKYSKALDKVRHLPLRPLTTYGPLDRKVERVENPSQAEHMANPRLIKPFGGVSMFSSDQMYHH